MTILKSIKLSGLVALLAFGLLFTQRISAQPGFNVPVESFYDDLAPYGRWMPYQGYGNVWMPDAGPDFQPYATNGHWVMTEYGNTWVSDYDWGWAPFHYGRWLYDPAYGGWLWLPGSDWAPAWVSWRSGGGYYGWAPLGPGMNININIPAPYWTFVPQMYITSPRLYSYCLPRTRVVNVYQQTTIINNVYRSNNRAYNYGPQRRDIERTTRQNVPVYRVEQLNRPGRSVVGNGSVGIYRPGNGNNRADGFANTNRPGYRENNVPNRGNYGGAAPAPGREYNGTPNRDYNRNGTNGASGRTYDGRMNEPSRGGFGGRVPAEGYNNAPPSADSPQPNRFERSRGAYSPGDAQPSSGYPTQPNRSYERPQQQAPMSAPSAPGGRRGGDFQRMPENRGMQAPAQSQPQRLDGGLGERRQRGPR